MTREENSGEDTSSETWIRWFEMASRRIESDATASRLTRNNRINGQQSCRTNLIQNAVIASLALTQVIQAGWIDMDTPLDKRTTKSFIDGTTYQLVRTVLKKVVHC